MASTNLDTRYAEELAFAKRLHSQGEVLKVETHPASGSIWITSLDGDKQLVWSFTKEIEGAPKIRDGAY